MKKIIALIFISFLVSSCATKNDLLKKLQGLDENHFKQNITITEDPLEHTTRIDTQKGFIADNGAVGSFLKGIGKGAASYSEKSITSFTDFFILAFIHKKTKQKSYQVYSYIEYIDNSWNFYRTANYGNPLKTVSTNEVDSDEDCHGKGSCTYTEQVTFPVTEEELRGAIENFTYDPNKLQYWSFKVRAKRGESTVGNITLQEIAALLAAVDEYVSKM